MRKITRPRWMTPWLVLPLVALVGAIGWFWLRPSDESAGSTPSATSRTVAVTQGSMSQTVAASGTVAPADTEDLAFDVSGTVTAVNVKAGDTVKAGQAVATIDSAELQAAVDQVQATRDTAAAELSDDEDADASDAQIAADETNLASAETALANAKDDLAGATLTSPIDGTVSSVGLTVGQTLGDSGTSGTGMTGSGSGSGQSAGGSSSDTSNQDTSPGGESTGSDSSSSSATGTIQVISTGSYVVDVSVDDTDIAKVKVGQEATVTPSTSSSTSNQVFGPGGMAGGPGGMADRAAAMQGDGSNDDDSDTETTQPSTTAAQQEASVTGKVTEVGTIADASSGVASYSVAIAFSGSADDWHSGATAAVDIVYAEVDDAIQVPSMAVQTDGSASTVTVVADGKTETRTVTTGQTLGGMTEIESGLEAGEQVQLTMPGAMGGGGSDDRGGDGGQGGFPGGGEGGFQPPSGEMPGGMGQ